MTREEFELCMTYLESLGVVPKMDMVEYLIGYSFSEMATGILMMAKQWKAEQAPDPEPKQLSDEELQEEIEAEDKANLFHSA